MIPANIKLNITEITEDNKKGKYVAVIGELAKALQIKTAVDVNPTGTDSHREEPLPVVDNIITDASIEYDQVLSGLVDGIISGLFGLQKAKTSKKFAVPKGIVYNPLTGKPVPREAWKKLNRAMDTYLTKHTGMIGDTYAARSVAVGSVVNRLEKQGKNPLTLTSQDIKNYMPKNYKFITVKKTLGWSEDISATLFYRADSFTNHVVDMNSRVKASVNNILIDGLQNQKTISEIERDLFDAHHKWNRDWSRIAHTEVQDSYSDGHMTTEVAMTPEDEPIYMIGMSAANACNICKRDIEGQVVRLLRKPPAGGNDKIDDPYTDTAIWIGKRSVGHSSKESWTAITRHPHCACRFVRWYPDMPQIPSV